MTGEEVKVGGLLRGVESTGTDVATLRRQLATPTSHQLSPPATTGQVEKVISQSFLNVTPESLPEDYYAQLFPLTDLCVCVCSTDPQSSGLLICLQGRWEVVTSGNSQQEDLSPVLPSPGRSPSPSFSFFSRPRLSGTPAHL